MQGGLCLTECNFTFCQWGWFGWFATSVVAFCRLSPSREFWALYILVAHCVLLGRAIYQQRSGTKDSFNSDQQVLLAVQAQVACRRIWGIPEIIAFKM